jgi:hypothetical protein
MGCPTGDRHFPIRISLGFFFFFVFLLGKVKILVGQKFGYAYSAHYNSIL